MDQLNKMTRPPHIRTFTVFSTGPRLLGLARDPKLLSGPGEPPPGFVGPTTSRSEWILYWALAKVFNDPINPRLPPFHGGEDWSYQTSVEGGRRERGGAVVDFVIYLPGQKIGLRLQTERFHVFAGPGKQSYDAVQERNLSRYMTIKDLYEQDLGLDDRTGRTAVARVVDLLGGRRRIDPVTTQRARRVRA
jgi:hypothetical protein